MLIAQPSARVFEVLAKNAHHQVDGPAVGIAHEAPERVPAHAERQRGVVVVVERAQRLVPHHSQSKSLSDPLNGEVAELLQLGFIPPSVCLGRTPVHSGPALSFMKTFIIFHTYNLLPITYYLFKYSSVLVYSPVSSE